MKKYTLVSFVFVLVLTLLVGFKFASASDSGCNGTGVYSTTTGQLCSTTTLQIGSRGAAVQAFQQTLKNAGFLTGKVDGIYGKMTSAAATAYYKIHPITQPTTVTPTPSTTSVSTPTSTTTTNPSIVINFPTAGATLVEGQTYNITWTASAGLPTTTAYRMDLFNTKVATIKIADINNIYSQNSFSWTVPSIPSWGGAVVPQDGYSVRMFLSDYSTAPYSSPTFKIVSNNSTTTLLPGCTSTSGYSSTNGVACDGSTPTQAFACTNGYDSKTGFVCGCTSTSGYSSTTGNSCGSASNFLPGCTSTSGYSSTNGVACNGSVSTPTYPAGCISNVGYSSTNGVACDGSTTAIAAPYISTCTSSGYDSATGFRCGCSSVNGYSSTTGLACGTASNFKSGCTSAVGFSSIDGSSCSQ